MTIFKKTLLAHEGALYEIEDLKSAREYLLKLKKNHRPGERPSPIILSNAPGSTRYYGMRALDRMFKILQDEFPSQINFIVVNVESDPIALHTAKQLGYENIKY